MAEVRGLGCLRGLVCLMGQPLGPLDWGTLKIKDRKIKWALQSE